VKKFILGAAFSILILAGSVVAQSIPVDLINRYEIMDLDFLRSHYTEINNGRSLQVSGLFHELHWIPPYKIADRLQAIGFNGEEYNAIQMTLKIVHTSPDADFDDDAVHYAFPVLLFHTGAGNLDELKELTPDERVTLYGRFYNLSKDDYAIEVDFVELDGVMTRVDPAGTPVYKDGGQDQVLLLDARVSPSPTPIPTFTPTPGPDLWMKLNHWINPKETITPTGTITPGP
jgi:hypothetical protein